MWLRTLTSRLLAQDPQRPSTTVNAAGSRPALLGTPSSAVPDQTFLRFPSSWAKYSFSHLVVKAACAENLLRPGASPLSLRSPGRFPWLQTAPRPRRTHDPSLQPRPAPSWLLCLKPPVKSQSGSPGPSHRAGGVSCAPGLSPGLGGAQPRPRGAQPAARCGLALSCSRCLQSPAQTWRKPGPHQQPLCPWLLHRWLSPGSLGDTLTSPVP